MHTRGAVCIYQTLPDPADPKVMSLAWLAEHAFPTTSVKFAWSPTYDFIWNQTGLMTPGIAFSAMQVWPADLTASNQVTLTHRDGAFTFASQTAGPHPGSLYITQDSTVPRGTAAVAQIVFPPNIFTMTATLNANNTWTITPSAS